MTLYYSLVFMLLVFEMALFLALIVPMPFTWKRRLFTFISENPYVAKLQYGLKITFIFITILFIDSVNRVFRVQLEVSNFSRENKGTMVAVGSERMEVQARKFYSQRNMYLCGFTLFLSLILNRTYIMILDVLRLEEENRALKGGDSKKFGAETSTSSGKLSEAGNMGEIGSLKRELEKRDRDIETLKKQAQGLSDEYNKLGDQVAPADGTTKKER